jgi:hypothetical protein
LVTARSTAGLLLQLKGFHDQLFSCHDPQVKPTARLALQGERRQMALRPALAAHADGGDRLNLQLGPLDRCPRCDHVEAKGQRGGDNLAQVANFHRDLRHPPAYCMAAGNLDDRRGYRQLVHPCPLKHTD